MVDLFVARPQRRSRFWLVLILPFLTAVLSGCQSVSYYKQAIQGQYQILAHREPISRLVTDPATTPSVREKLTLVLALRAFAESNLNLPANDHYLRYVDLHRRFVVWNVHAAPEFSLKPKTWWYPIVGSLKYRGYFSERMGRDYARKLEEKHFDVYVEGVEAYSTLGWFADPVLNTFIHHEPMELAEIIFHELAHQRVFIRGDTDFNEAFATATAQEGVRRWLRASNQPDAYSHYVKAIQRNTQFVSLIMTARRRLDALYRRASVTDSQDRAETRAQKENIILDLRRSYDRLKSEWGGYSGYDRWVAQPLNNAQLNTVATYYELVPAFETLLQANAGSLEAFYRAVRQLGKLPKPERHRRLDELLPDHER